MFDWLKDLVGTAAKPQKRAARRETRTVRFDSVNAYEVTALSERGLTASIPAEGCAVVAGQNARARIAVRDVHAAFDLETSVHVEEAAGGRLVCSWIMLTEEWRGLLRQYAARRAAEQRRK